MADSRYTTPPPSQDDAYAASEPKWRGLLDIMAQTVWGLDDQRGKAPDYPHD